MGARLVAHYEEIGKELGALGRMKLAMLTHIPSAKAQDAEDSPANVQLFQNAIAQLRKELKG